MRLRERGCEIVQTNVASVLANGLSGPPRASGRPAVPISGLTHPLTEVFQPLPPDPTTKPATACETAASFRPGLEPEDELRSMP